MGIELTALGLLMLVAQEGGHNPAYVAQYGYADIEAFAGASLPLPDPLTYLPTNEFRSQRDVEFIVEELGVSDDTTL